MRMTIRQVMSQLWRWFRHEWRLILVWLLITLSIYGRTLSHELVWDDGWFIDWEGYQLETVSWQRLVLGDVPMADGQVYRPLRSLWYVIAIAFWQKWPAGLHLQGILVHFLAAVVVWQLFLRLLKNRLGAYWAAAIFAVHPIHIEAVSWITASFDTIGIVLMLAAWWLFVKGEQDKEPWWERWALVIAGMAFFTYELTVVLVPLVMAYEWLLGKGSRHRLRLVWWWQRFKTWTALVAGYVLVRSLALADASAGLEPVFCGLFERLALALVLVVRYVRLMLWPYPQSINHEVYPGVTNFWYADEIQSSCVTMDWTEPVVWGSGLVLVGLVWLWFAAIRRWPVAAYLGLVAVVGLAPVVQIIPLNSVFAERYAYVASVGVAGLLGWGLGRLGDKLSMALGLLVTGIFTSLLLARNQVWATTVTLWESAVAATPTSVFALENLGGSYYIYQDYDQAIVMLERAKEVAPDRFPLYQKLVILYELNQNEAGAMRIKDEAAVRFR